MSITPSIPEIQLFYLRYELENSSSRSQWVQHLIDSHPFCSISIQALMHEIKLFQNLTFKVNVMCKVQVQGHKVDPISYQLTPLLFQFHQPPYSSDISYFKILTMKIQGHVHSSRSNNGSSMLLIGPPIPEIQLVIKLPWNPGSRSWVRLKLHSWSIDSHSFPSMSISPPITELQLKKKKPWKWSHILLTCIPFIQSQLALPFLRCSYFKIRLWKSKVKVILQGHCGSNILSTRIPFIPY